MTPAAADAVRLQGRDPRDPGPLFAKLKPGPGHSSAEVEANQRARLLGAMVELVAEGGFPSLKVRALARAAGVSTRTLYRHFGNLEECFAATYDALMSCAARRVGDALRAAGEGEPGLRAGLRELAQILAEQPKEAHLVLVDAYAAGPALRERMRAAGAEFAGLLAATLEARPGGAAVSPRLAQAMVAGVMHVARAPMLAAEGADAAGVDPPPPAPDQVADWILSLRGSAAAGRAVARRGSASGRLAAPEPRWDLGAALRGEVGDERGRILAAAARLGARDGYAALTVPRIRSEAGVSRRSFDAHFAGVEDCFLAAVEALALTVLAEAERLAAGGGWMTGVQRATLALCTEAARNRGLARLAFVEVLAPGLEGLRRRERVISTAAAGLRAAAPPKRRPSHLAPEASVAAAWQVLQAELGAGRGEDLPQLAPALAYLITAPGPPRAHPAPP